MKIILTFDFELKIRKLQKLGQTIGSLCLKTLILGTFKNTFLNQS